MTQRERPTVGRLALYLILIAGFTGAMTGWAYASGAVTWARTELISPDWRPPIGAIVWLWIAKTFLIGLALWTVERFGRDGWRWLSVAAILALFAVGVLWSWVLLVERAVVYGFLAALAAWTVGGFAVWITGKASGHAALLLWPVMAWLTFALVLTFEVMRLNTGV